jgi:hypothetical protein
MRTAFLALTLTAGLVVSGGAALAQDASDPTGLTIGAIEAKLWYEETGRLSENVIGGDFILWNAIIGEGDAEEPASDMLVTVQVVSAQGERLVAIPLVLEMIDEDGEVLERREKDSLFISTAGQTVEGFWLQDRTGEGPVQFRATLGDQSRSVAVDFSGGE